MKKKKTTKQLLRTKEAIINGLDKLRGYLMEEKKPTILSLADKEVIINRLNKLQWQIDDIKAMVESDEYYYDITKQIEYSRRALNSTETLLLESHSVPLQ